MNTRHSKMNDITFSLIMIVSLILSLFGVGAQGIIQQRLDTEDVFVSAPEGLDEGEYIVGLSTSYFSSCAVRNDGAVECWGSNSRGQLGDGTTISRNLPAEVIGLDDEVVQVDVGTGHTCALLENGGVQCWGNNSSGQLGIGSTENSLEPVDVIGLPGEVDMIGSGYKHTCALLKNGDVYCWGRNLDGQLGDGTTDGSNSPRKVVGISGNVVNLIVGADHNCILFDDGNLQCWGANYDGQLGDGTDTYRSSPVDVVSLGDEVKFASAGYFHTCAVLKNGSAQCWGYNVSGELGNGTAVSSKTPVYVIGLPSSVEKIATGYEHTCALLDGGEVYCWGYNASGELGGTYGYSSYTPKKVVGLDANTVEIATSGSHNCILTSVGGVKCWGKNEVGQLGDGVEVLKSTPTKVIGLNGDVSFVSAGGSHTCVLMVTGGVKCWGSGGQLGISSTIPHFSPVDVWGLSSGVKAIAAGASHTCALMETGGVKCWGINYHGQLGNNSLEDSYIPVDVVNLGGEVVEIAAGLWHTCALLKTGEVQCWGYLDSCFDSSCVSPAYVDGFDGNVTAIAIGTRHICGILESGEIQCWGDDTYGQLGDGDAISYYDPTYVVGLADKSIDITADYYHSCTVLENGNAYCWGDNKYGQLGDGTVIERISPVNVVGLNGQATQITTGDRSSCALLSSGGVKCWGENGDGELGNGTVEDSYIPVTNLINNAVQVDLGAGHGCALLASGEVYCWGYNSTGQVGDGTAYYRPSPEYVVGMIPVVTYNGGAEITSDQPIVAIGRPHMGAEIMGYNGINSGANTLYLPMLFNNIWNYTSTFTVENTTSSTATYTLTFKDGGNGTISCVMSGETLPGHGVRTYDVTKLGACDSGYLPDPWAGGAKIESDQPLVAIATPKVEGTDPVTYNAFTGGADTVYLPMLFRNVWGYTSAFYVQNLDSTQNATITIDFYDALGHFTCRYEDSSPIGPAVTRGYWVPSMNCNDGNSFPAEGWAGSAVIESSGGEEIVAIGRPHMGTEVAAYNGFTEGGTSNYLPMLFRNMWGYNSAFYIQNVSGYDIYNEFDEGITIDFYDAEGNFTCTYIDNERLKHDATRGYWLPSLDCSSGSFPAEGWVGSATIKSAGEVIAVGRSHLSDGEVIAYDAFIEGTTETYVPMLFRKYNGNESALYIQNLGESDAHVTITYYDEESGYYCAMAQEISPLSTSGVWLAGLDNSVCVP